MCKLRCNFINKITNLFDLSKIYCERDISYLNPSFTEKIKMRLKDDGFFPEVSQLKSSYTIVSRPRACSPDPHRTKRFPSLFPSTCPHKEITSSQEYLFIYWDTVPTSPEPLSSQQWIVLSVPKIPGGNVVCRVPLRVIFMNLNAIVPPHVIFLCSHFHIDKAGSADSAADQLKCHLLGQAFWDTQTLRIFARETLDSLS